MTSSQEFVFDQFKFEFFPTTTITTPQMEGTPQLQDDNNYLSQHNLQQQQFYTQQEYAFNGPRVLSQSSLVDMASSFALSQNHVTHYPTFQERLLQDFKIPQYPVVNEEQEPENFSSLDTIKTSAAAGGFKFYEDQSGPPRNLFPQVDTTSVSPQEPPVELLSTLNTHYPVQPVFVSPFIQEKTIAYDFRDRFYSDVTTSSCANSSSFDNFSPVSSQSSYSANSIHESAYPKYRVVRGISSGGTASKPPKVPNLPGHHFKQVELELNDASVEAMCLPEWNESEKQEKRRIIRLERYQVANKIVCDFKILDSSKEHSNTSSDLPNGVDVVEVSCLEAFNRPSDDLEEDEATPAENGLQRSFYITSVEVIKIVELLIGVGSQDLGERRRERGRIRSNLVPFWSKKPISSRMSGGNLNFDSNDFRIELATRIMSYETRKPRGFDKEVRILKWGKLFKSLKRALQSYYVEVPDSLTDEDDKEEEEEDEEEAYGDNEYEESLSSGF